MAMKAMELLRYNQLSCVKVLTTERRISVANRASIRISKSVVAECGFAVGDRVALMQSARDPKQWWLTWDRQNGFHLRKVRDGSLRFSNRELVKKLLASLAWTRPSAAMPVGDRVVINGEAMWPLLTHGIKPTSNKKD